MMNFLFLFLDGVGLGADDPEVNPFARAHLPHLQDLLDGQRLIRQDAPHIGSRASLLALDTTLGVPGLPQSATGQASLLTGENIPAAIGQHYGPKPNREITAHIQEGTIFSQVKDIGLKAALLNAYPPRYFDAIHSGRRLHGTIPLSVTRAGIPLKTAADLYSGQALSADFTGQGWRERLSIPETPVISPYEAGERLVELSSGIHFSFFEYWLTDYAGHRQDMEAAIDLLETFDAVISGLLDQWDDRNSLILITSDHGNLEDLSTRRHTSNPAPALVIGPPEHRQNFIRSLRSLTDIAQAIWQFIQN